MMNINVNNISNQYAGLTSGAPERSSSSALREEAAPRDSVSVGGEQTEDMSADAEALARRIVGKRGNISEVTVLKGGDGDDTVKISRGENGGLKVDINGETRNLTASQAEKLVIDGGKGNDTITADKDLFKPLYITGGEGNDIIVGGAGDDVVIDSFGANRIEGGRGSDALISSGLDLDASSPEVMSAGGRSINGSIIIGGPGSDYIEGGRGADLLSGGDGNDSVYGLGGDDIIFGGGGRNYSDGGAGNDIIRDHGRSSVIFGGKGDDALRLNGSGLIADSYGSNIIEASNAQVRVINNGSGALRAAEGVKHETVEPSAVPDNFKIEGGEAYRERVSSDLDSLANLAIGQKMLDSIAQTGKEVTIKETDWGNQCAGGPEGYLKDDHRTPGLGVPSTVTYNRATVTLKSDAAWRERPPMVGLYHEMAHSYNYATGTMDSWAYEPDGRPATGPGGTLGAEFQAVGLDNRNTPANPQGLTENAMREELGLPRRDRY